MKKNKKKLHNNFLMIYIFENKRTTIAEGKREKKWDPQLDGKVQNIIFFFHLNDCKIHIGIILYFRQIIICMF
jgi:hypothetical protein